MPETDWDEILAPLAEAVGNYLDAQIAVLEAMRDMQKDADQ